MCKALMEIREEGIKEGESVLSRLALLMHADGREKDFFECCEDEKKRKKLYEEYDIKQNNMEICQAVPVDAGGHRKFQKNRHCFSLL